MPTDYVREREFFDRVATRSRPVTMPRATLQRYASPRWPHLFAKEMMFQLAGGLRGKRVLEVGCGEGRTSVQLAYCGAAVEAIDLSPASIEVARRRAELNGQSVNFLVGDFIRGEVLAEGSFDVVWCDLILHHLVDSLDAVLGKIRRYLKPGGLFVAREPVAYTGWLKALRRFVPVKVPATPDEQPFREAEFQVVRRHFPDVQRKYYRILARADRVSGNLSFLRLLARVDNLLLTLPGTAGLAGNAVLWATKPEATA
jgi:SAM-dependent methyltransferase